jgi:hypothetical protein
MEKKFIIHFIETYLKRHELHYIFQDDRKKQVTLVKILPKQDLLVPGLELTMRIYQSYIIMDFFGVSIMDQYTNIDEFKMTKIFYLLDHFFKGDLKIKIFIRKGTAFFWKIYILTENAWKLYEQNGAYLPYWFTKHDNFELSLREIATFYP